MKLNSGRFYNFISDKTEFSTKKNTAIFRGPCHRPHRQHFIKKCFKMKGVDAGDTRNQTQAGACHKPFTSIEQQLEYKFILSVEGNDVASNLPWIMASNSLAFMTQPVFEGWFMQGKLVPNIHYVLLKDDYSDLEEKIDYFSSNDGEALEIIHNAKKHVSQFFDKENELLISLLTLQRYFEQSGQL